MTDSAIQRTGGGLRDRAAGGWRAGALARSLVWPLVVATAVFDMVLLAWGRAFGPDTWIALTGGRYVSRHGLPHTDTLSAAGHGRAWIDQQWLAQLVYYHAWSAGGDAAVSVLSALAVASAAGLLAALVLRRGAPPMLMLTIVLSGTLVELLFFSVTRAQSFAYPLFAGLVWLMLADLDRGRFGRANLIGLPILVLWANLHGSVLLGAGLLASLWAWRAAAGLRAGAGSDAGRYLALAAASLACPLATPYGLDIIGYYSRLLSDPALRVANEWQSASFALSDLPFLAVAAAVLGLAAHASGRGLSAPRVQLAGLAALGLAGAYALRYQVWFTLAATPVLAQVAAELRAGRPAGRPFAGRLAAPCAALLAAFTVAAAVFVGTAPGSAYTRAVSSTALDASARYALAHPDARILADDVTGSALLWQYPRLAGRVAYDSRIEIYRPAGFLAFARYLSVQGAHWMAPARGYQVLAVSCSYHPALCPALAAQPGWRVLARSVGGIVLVRR